MNPLFRLHDLGQSPWLDYVRRSLVTSGGLKRLVDEYAVSGLTSNPSIFQKAVIGSTDYDDALRARVERGERDPKAIFLSLAIDDIRMAADVLRPVYDRTGGSDGFISLEVSPDLAHDTAATIQEARELFRRVERPNVMIKVPATPEGLPAIEELTAQGVNVNITLLFDVRVYEKVALAYMSGLERRLAAGHSVDTLASVASFFVSRVDTAVDSLLPEDSLLRGRVAIANAKLAYQRFKNVINSQRWRKLAAARAKIQRLLWGSTGTKNPNYSDVLYVDELIGPQTVNTMPESTLYAFADHGRAQPTLEQEVEEAEMLMSLLPDAAIDFDAVLAKLLADGVEAFAADFRKLLAGIGEKCDQIREGKGAAQTRLGTLQSALEETLGRLEREQVSERIWQCDHTVWKPDPSEITNRLGWLTLPERMHDHLRELEAFAATCAEFDRVVLLGMGGSSLAAEVLAKTFGGRPLVVLDSTHPEAVLAIEKGRDLEQTLFIVASKSGGTVETLSHLAYFFEKVQDGSQFIAITDAGSPLEALARQRRFRRIFLNSGDVGGRYSALSYFGLVPAALLGLDLHGLLDAAEEMACACGSCVPAPHNPGLYLGALMGTAAQLGRDKLTIILPEDVSSFGNWLEQLIAESTGKEGIGIVPVVGEPLGPLEVYGNDRLFVSLDVETDLEPALLLPFAGRQKLGAEFFRWEFATAVAGHVLGIHPFDQPNVEEAKEATRHLLEGDHLPTQGLDDLKTLLQTIRPGDYIALQSYLAPTSENEMRLAAARLALRDRFRVATTLGFGPRFLHSTGQLHKGGPASGVFIHVADEPSTDLPIPGRPFTFRRLLDAQAAGDLEALRRRGRQVARARLEDLEEVI